MTRAAALPDRPPQLTLRIAWQVAWGSIKVRLSRSLVTVSSIVLAVAFLSSILGEAIATRAAYEQWYHDTRPVRQANALRRDLAGAREAERLLQVWAADASGVAAWVAAHTDEELPTPPGLAPAAQVLTWLQGLNDTDRYKILGDASEPVPWLLNMAQHRDHLLQQADAMTGVAFPLQPADLDAISHSHEQLRAGLAALHQAEQARLALIAEHGGSAAILQAITNASGDGGAMHEPTTATAWLQARGIEPTQTFGTGAAWQASTDPLQLGRLLAIERVQKKALSLLAEFNRGRPGKQPIALDAALRGEISDPATAAAVEKLLADNISTKHNLLQTLTNYVPARAHQETLRRSFNALGYDPSAGNRETFWLVMLSLLVCVVGIVNSMMMAVTERFREIATMKCLGAMDGFIVKAFLLESGGMGLAGSLFGGLLGILLAISQGWWAYSGTFWQAAPLAEMLTVMLLAMLVGMVLTVLGALAPAIIAARMHPMDAMRLEA